MTAVVFTEPLSYYVKLESGFHILASDYNVKNKANNLLKSMNFSEIVVSC